MFEMGEMEENAFLVTGMSCLVVSHASTYMAFEQNR